MSSNKKVLIFLSGYPSHHGDGAGKPLSPEAINILLSGRDHIKEAFEGFEINFICGLWDGVGEDEVRAYYNPLKIYSYSQSIFQAAIYPFIKQKLVSDSMASAKWKNENSMGSNDKSVEHRPISRDLSQLFIRQQTIRSTLSEMSLDELTQYDFFLYCRYDITNRGSADVSHLPKLNTIDLTKALETNGRTVILPIFNQLNEGYPDMWFIFNLAGLIGYSQIYEMYAESNNDMDSEYRKLMTLGWPNSEYYDIRNFRDPKIFTNVELNGKNINPNLAKYPDWQVCNIHAFHKYFFALSSSPYKRIFVDSLGKTTQHSSNEKINKLYMERKYIESGTPKIPLLLYTHSTYGDVFKVFLGEFVRYWKDNFKIIVACEEKGLDTIKSISMEFDEAKIKYIGYKEEAEYSVRVQDILSQIIDYQYILFMHEDMIPTARPDMSVLNDLRDFMTVENLPYLGITKNTTYERSERITKYISCATTGYRYVVQPSLISPILWIEKLRNLPRPMSIWQIEDFFTSSIDKVYFCDQEQSLKRGQAHYETLSLPHISTAITKGKWNFSEYPYEISRISKRYNIDLNKRKCV